MGGKDICETCMVPKNQRKKEEECGLCTAWEVTNGRWKMYLLWILRNGKKRFCEIEEETAGISAKVLTTQLRELEADGLISRTVYDEMPPRVEYSLTALGEEFVPVLEKMTEIGKRILQIQ